MAANSVQGVSAGNGILNPVTERHGLKGREETRLPPRNTAGPRKEMTPAT